MYVAVLFRVDEEKAIGYKKAETKDQLARYIVKNIDKIDFISIRNVNREITRPEQAQLRQL